MAVVQRKAWGTEFVTSANMNAYTGPPPATVDVDPLPTAIANTNFDTLVISDLDIYNGHKASSGAQNDQINFDVLLAAGTWTFELIYRKNTDQGIVTVQLSTDASVFTAVNASPYNGSTATIDTYAAAASYGNRTSITGITIIITGIYRLRLVMASKNASASSYFGRLNRVQFRRTA